MNVENYIKQNDIIVKTDNSVFTFFLSQNTNSVKIIVKCDTVIANESINLHFSFNQKVQLQHNVAWKLSITKDDANIKKYGKLAFDLEDSLDFSIERANNSITVLIPKKNNENQFAFCPTITIDEKEFSLIAEFITPKYIETWFLLDENNEIYINDIFKLFFAQRIG